MGFSPRTHLISPDFLLNVLSAPALSVALIRVVKERWPSRENESPQQFPAGGLLRSLLDDLDQKFRWTRKLTESVPTLPYW